MPPWQATAARSSGTARAAPDASPSRIPKSSSGARPSAASRAGPPVSAETCAACVWASAPRCSRASERDRRDADEAVQQHGHAQMPGGQRRAEQGRRFAAAERHRDAQRIAAMRRVPGERRIDRCALASKPLVVEAGAAAGPARAVAAEQGRRQRRRGGRVANAHFAEAEQIGSGLDCLVAGADRLQEHGFRHGGPEGEIVRGRVEVEREHPQCGIRVPGKLIDRGSAGREIRDHLRRDGRRVRRYAARRDAVIAREYQHLDALKAWDGAPLPAREPRRKRLQPAEAAGRFRELRLPRHYRCLRRLVARREVEARGAQGFEVRGWRDHVGFSGLVAMAWKKLPVTRPDLPPDGPELAAVAVREHGERRVRAGFGDRRVVELVSAQPRAGASERPVRKQQRGSVAERHAPLREARDVVQQPEHSVRGAVRRDQRAAENHMATALAMHRAALGEAAHALEKPRRGGERWGVQFRVAARQPAGIAIVRGSLVGQRRERVDRGTRPPPPRQQVRIDEAEGCVLGERDALSGGRQGGFGRGCRGRQGGRQRQDAVEIEPVLADIGQAFEEGRERAEFLRLHEPEMTLRQ